MGWKDIRLKESDIVEHLGILRGLAMQCSVVVEFGMRTGMSTAAMLDGTKCHVHSYDVDDCRGAVDAMKKLAPERFFFHKADTTKLDKIPECDMLFCDSQHDYATLSRELRMEGKVKKWIVMHDTKTFRTAGKTKGDPGLQKAIDEFLGLHEEWRLMLYLPNQNGMTILERRG